MLRILQIESHTYPPPAKRLTGFSAILALLLDSLLQWPGTKLQYLPGMLVVMLVAVGLLLISWLTGNGTEPGSEYVT